MAGRPETLCGVIDPRAERGCEVRALGTSPHLQGPRRSRGQKGLHHEQRSHGPWPREDILCPGRSSCLTQAASGVPNATWRTSAINETARHSEQAKQPDTSNLHGQWELVARKEILSRPVTC